MFQSNDSKPLNKVINNIISQNPAIISYKLFRDKLIKERANANSKTGEMFEKYCVEYLKSQNIQTKRCDPLKILKDHMCFILMSDKNQKFIKQ